MKYFFNTIKDSIFSPNFYRQLASKPLSFSFKYFAGLSILLIGASLVLALPWIVRLEPLFKNIGSEVVQWYPDELTVTIKDGKASSNVSEPFILPLPASMRSTEDLDSPALATITTALVINTKEEFSYERFMNYHTIALLTKDVLVFYDGEQLRINALSEFPDFEINETKIVSWIAAISPWLNTGVFAVCYFMVLVASFLAHLVYLLLAALLVMLLFKVKKLSIGYARAYQVALHASTLGLLIAVIDYFRLHYFIPFFGTIVLLIVVAVNCFGEKEQVVLPQSEATKK